MKSRRLAGVALLVALNAAVFIASLSAGGAEPQAVGLRPRRVISDETGFTTDVSRDGRLVIAVMQAFGQGTNDNPSRLVIRDLLTKATTTLVVGLSPYGSPAAIFSADAKNVAYGWSTQPPSSKVLLNVIGTTSGATPRTLASVGGIVPHAWSPDGGAILALVHGAGANIADSTSISWVSVADGSVRTIKTLEPWRKGASLARPRLSPDGKWIAYSAVAREGSPDTYVYVIDANGQNERVVASIAGSNMLPVWTPDGAHLIFVNVQAARRDLLAVSVRVGGLSHGPARLLPGFAGDPIGISRSGDFFYMQPDYMGFHEVISERRSGGAGIVQTFHGQSGTWSKGNRLAFIRPGQQGNDLIVRSLDTGEERLYRHPGISNVPARWLSNGSAVVVYIQPAGDGGRAGGSFYRVDLNTGNFTWLFAKDTAEYVRSSAAALSPDDKILYLTARANAQGPWTRIVGVDLATGLERSVATLPGTGVAGNLGLAIKPDGTALAIHAGDGRIMTVRPDGREYHELVGSFPVPGGGWPDLMKWTPDGQSIVFVTEGSLPAGGWRVMRVSVSGGQPEFDGLDSSKLESSVPLPRLQASSVYNIDLSPDGSRIVFSQRAVPTYDVWTVANVMGLASAR